MLLLISLLIFGLRFTGFSDLHPYLFARYIPNILPPTKPEDLDKYIEEAQQMQRDLRSHPEFTIGDQV